MSKKRKNEPVAEMLRAHADAVFKMPVSEQFMGARDVAFHSAMRQLADWIDSVEQRLRKDTHR